MPLPEQHPSPAPLEPVARERFPHAEPTTVPYAPAQPVGGAPRTPRTAANTGWRVMNVVSRSRWLRDAVCTMAQARARTRGYRPGNELARGLAGSVLAPLDIEARAGRLASDGFCEGLVLHPDVVDKLVSFALLGVCYGNSDLGCGFNYADRQRAEAATGRTFSLATYLFTDEVESLIGRIASDPQLRAVIAQYFGVPPVYLGRRIWWTMKTPEHLYDRQLTTSHFHYDRDDYRSVRVFFHLTAVDPQHGPHVVVRGSHRRKALVHQLSLQERTDGNIERYYGSDHVVTIQGPAGTGFIEDTYCFHKATRPIAGDRLMLELGFGLQDHRRFPPPDRSAASMIPLA